jgi:hypothetical protein
MAAPVPQATIHLITPGGGNPANAQRTAMGLASLANDVRRSSRNLQLIGLANLPVDSNDLLIINAAAASQVRRVLRNVAEVRAFHARQIEWLLLADGNQLIVDLALMDAQVWALQQALWAYYGSQAASWLAPVVGLGLTWWLVAGIARRFKIRWNGI